MVIGETGVGKSTVANMIYNKDFSTDLCKYPFKTGNTAASVTKASTMQYHSIFKSFVLDTVGVGDPQLADEEILGNVRNLVRNASKGVNAVVVVMKMARVPQATRANMYVLERLFAARDLLSHGVLVLTHWDGEVGEEKQSLKDWIGRDKEIKDMVRRFGKVILTNNQLTGRGAYPECREKCLKELLHFIDEKTEKIRARPVDFLEIFNDLIAHFVGTLWKRTLSVKDLVIGSERSIPVFSGECAVCHEQIEMHECAHLPCNHSFHCDCLSSQSLCPLWNRSRKECKSTRSSGDFSNRITRRRGSACVEPLDALAAAATPFAALPALQVPETKATEVMPFEATVLPILLRMRPVQDLRKLHCSWQLPPNYIGHLVGHEGAGSLQSFLKRQGLATEVEAGVGEDEDFSSNRWCSIFSVDITLTDLGFTKWMEVAHVLFLYLAMPSEVGLRRAEKGAGDVVAVSGREEMEPMEYVQKLACEMLPDLKVAPEHLLTLGRLVGKGTAKSEWMLSRWEPAKVTQFLDLMQPERCFTILVANFGGARRAPAEEGEDREEEEDFAEDPELPEESPAVKDPHFDREVAGAPQVEPHFGTEYWRADKAEVDRLAEAGRYLRLPDRNPFFPNDLEVRPLTEEESNDSLESWMKNMEVGDGARQCFHRALPALAALPRRPRRAEAIGCWAWHLHDEARAIAMGRRMGAISEAKPGDQNPAGERALQAGVETVASHAQRTDALPVVLIETGFFRPRPATSGRQKQPQRPAQSACLVLTETARSNPEAVEKLQTRQAQDPEVVLPRCVAWERVQEKLTCRALSSKGNGLHKTPRLIVAFCQGCGT
eukprot:s1203_g6.t1